MWIKFLFWWPSFYQKAVMSWEQDWSSPKFKKKTSNLTCKPTLIKVKYVWGILQIYWKYISKVYLKCPSIILETYFKFTSTILQVYFNLLRRRRRRRKEEEEVYFKSILFQQKEYIWSTFVKLNWLNLKYTSSILESYLKCTF